MHADQHISAVQLSLITDVTTDWMHNQIEPPT